MARMAKGGFSCLTMEETEYLIKKPHAKVWEEKNWVVEILMHTEVKAAIERHLAMALQNHMARCLPCQHCTAKNPQTRWRRRGTGAPPPSQRREPTPEPTPHLPGTPPAPTGNHYGAQRSQINILPPSSVYSHTSLPCAESFRLDAYAQDSQHNTDFNPDMLTDEETSTG